MLILRCQWQNLKTKTGGKQKMLVYVWLSRSCICTGILMKGWFKPTFKKSFQAYIFIPILSASLICSLVAEVNATNAVTMCWTMMFETIVFLNYKWTLKFLTLLTFVSSYSQTYNLGIVSAYEKLSCNVRIYLRWKILKIATWIIYFNYTSFILLPCIKTTSISAWSMIH